MVFALPSFMLLRMVGGPIGPFIPTGMIYFSDSIQKTLQYYNFFVLKALLAENIGQILLSHYVSWVTFF